VDLFANHASSIYYDDISLPPAKPALPAFTCEEKPIHVDPLTLPPRQGVVV